MTQYITYQSLIPDIYDNHLGERFAEVSWQECN